MYTKNNALTTEYPDFSSVGSRYAFVSTKQFIEDVKAQGFTVSKTATPKRGKGFGKHLVEFTHPQLPSVGDNNVRLLAVNAHNGTSSFQFKLGIFRLVCSNGLVVGNSIASERIIHVGYAPEKVARATDLMLDKAQALTGTIQTMLRTEPSIEQRIAFAVKAAELRDAKPFHVLDLLAIRRSEDKANDAWTVYNRVQEALVRGGYTTQEYVPETAQTVEGKRARGITGIAQGIELNQALWDLAQSTLL